MAYLFAVTVTVDDVRNAGPFVEPAIESHEDGAEQAKFRSAALPVELGLTDSEQRSGPELPLEQQ